MFSFCWKSRYSVGIKVLDSQHQAFMGRLNELHEAMMGGNVNDAAGPLITTLVALAREHFATEEDLMQSTGYPGLAEHRAHHEELTAKVGEFIARYQRGDKTVYANFMYFVRDWLTRHMEKEDRDYAPWLAGHGIH